MWFGNAFGGLFQQGDNDNNNNNGRDDIDGRRLAFDRQQDEIKRVIAELQARSENRRNSRLPRQPLPRVEIPNFGEMRFEDDDEPAQNGPATNNSLRRKLMDIRASPWMKFFICFLYILMVFLCATCISFAQHLQVELIKTKSHLYNTESHLEKTSTKLFKTKVDLDVTKSHLDVAKARLHNAESHLNMTKWDLNETKSRLDQTQLSLDVIMSHLMDATIFMNEEGYCIMEEDSYYHIMWQHHQKKQE